MSELQLNYEGNPVVSILRKKNTLKFLITNLVIRRGMKAEEHDLGNKNTRKLHSNVCKSIRTNNRVSKIKIPESPKGPILTLTWHS